MTKQGYSVSWAGAIGEEQTAGETQSAISACGAEMGSASALSLPNRHLFSSALSHRSDLGGRTANFPYDRRSVMNWWCASDCITHNTARPGLLCPVSRGNRQYRGRLSDLICRHHDIAPNSRIRRVNSQLLRGTRVTASGSNRFSSSTLSVQYLRLCCALGAPRFSMWRNVMRPLVRS